MRAGTLAAAAGMVLGVVIPEWRWVPLLPALWALAPVAALCCYWRSGRLLALLLLAFGYGHASVQNVRSQQADLLQPLPITVLARVDAVSGSGRRRAQLTVTVQRTVSERAALQAGARLRLSWFDGPVLQVGEHWQLTAVLRPVQSLRNPGGFDYRRWLLAQRVLAGGSVRSGVLAQPLPAGGLGGLRQQLAEHLLQQPRGTLLLALLLGDRSYLSAADMEVVRATGTIHLFVVSGLHISMMGGLGLVLGRWLGRALVAGRCQGDARWTGFGVAVLFAGAYVLMAGAALPAVRALLMTLLGGVLLVRGRLNNAFDVWLLVLLLLLLVDPLIALAAGTWLSFGAVAALLWFWTPRSMPGWPRALLLTQALLTGLSAVLLVQFGSPFGPASPLANLLAVPVVTLLAVPAAMVGAASWLLDVHYARWLLDVASGALEILWVWLELWSAVPLWYAQRPLALGLLTVTAALFLARRVTGWWSLCAVLAGFSVLSITTRAAPPAGEFRVWVFDVGQGSAALVQTRRHDLLFDAAPSYPQGLDMGAAIIVPSLAQLGVRRLDGMVISHDDTDHAGGAAALRSALPVTQLWRSGLPPDSAERRDDGLDGRKTTRRSCTRGQSWHWDGVRFEFLHPPSGPRAEAGGRAGNERSCMLRISSEHAAALLTGDTGRSSEQQLVRGGLASVDMLTVPHHGSAGSSDHAFVRLLRPRVAIVSAGRFNQYNHPRPVVRERYRRSGARFVTTAEEGALLWRSVRPHTVVKVPRDGRVGR